MATAVIKYTYLVVDTLTLTNNATTITVKNLRFNISFLKNSPAHVDFH